VEHANWISSKWI